MHLYIIKNAENNTKIESFALSAALKAIRQFTRAILLVPDADSP